MISEDDFHDSWAGLLAPEFMPNRVADQSDFLQGVREAQAKGASPGLCLSPAMKQNNANIGVYFFTTEYPDGLIPFISHHIVYKVMQGRCRHLGAAASRTHHYYLCPFRLHLLSSDASGPYSMGPVH
jgi:hypothetical protein